MSKNALSPFSNNQILPFILLLILLAQVGTIWAVTSKTESPVLQYRVSGHVLGFGSDGVLATSRDHMLRIRFVDADSQPITDNQGQFREVRYSNLWPGVDLQYDAVPGALAESTWTIAPGADPEQILLGYSAPVELTPAGALKIHYENGFMSESAPIAWQEVEGKILPVEVSFHLAGETDSKHFVGFSLGSYDPGRTLYIDPVLQWNSFFGGASTDEGRAIAVDTNGNTYITGFSQSTWGAPVSAYAGLTDVFVVKFDRNGNRLWNTFLGSASLDRGYGIDIDIGGNVYLTGYSQATWGAPVNAHSGGGWDIFAVKLDSNGNRVWNTFLGAAGANDEGNGVAVDDSGNVYVVGFSNATWGAPLGGFAYVGNKDAVMAKLNINGARVWHVFLGSAGDDWAQAVVVDNADRAVVVGTSSGTWKSPELPYNGDKDAFVARFSNAGALLWNTFLGSASYDDALDVTVDNGSNVYISGTSQATWGAPVDAYAGLNDAYAAKLSSAGALQWHTFMGSVVDDDWGRGIVVAANNTVYVGGTSGATWGVPSEGHNGALDIFVARLSNNGKRERHTFRGSANDDEGNGIALVGSGNPYMTGWSASSWGSPVTDHAGGVADGFVALVDPAACTYFTIPYSASRSVTVCM